MTAAPYFRSDAPQQYCNDYEAAFVVRFTALVSTRVGIDSLRLLYEYLGNRTPISTLHVHVKFSQLGPLYS